METQLTLYYAPRTRAFTVLWLLEELGVDYDLESFDIYTGRHKRPDYLALNPMGKVPLVVDNGRPVSETGAIAVYLADKFGAGTYAPTIDDPDRAAYLRWMFFVGGVIEPAYAQKFTQQEINPASAAWGSFEHMVENLEAALETGPWLLGERFTAADVIVGSSLRFGVTFGILPADSIIGRYVERVSCRGAFARANAIEAREGERFPPQTR